MRSLILSSILLAVLALSGCYYDKEELLYPGECNPGDATVAGYWTSTVQPLIQARCASAGCHVSGGTGPGDFTQYANVKARVDDGRFQQVVLVQGSMPPSGSLPACDQQKLQAWINAGAPN
jgi:hypothetical protein